MPLRLPFAHFASSIAGLVGLLVEKSEHGVRGFMLAKFYGGLHSPEWLLSAWVLYGLELACWLHTVYSGMVPRSPRIRVLM